MHPIHDAEVLILGTGLSGLRAAMAARKAGPSARITVASLARGASGSSFANQNNALGMQVPADDPDREAFVREVLDLAGPGTTRRRLVEVMAAEALPRLRDLEALGLKFRRNADRKLRLATGCFSAARRCAVFDDLNHAYNQFIKKLDGCEITFLTEQEVLGLVVEADAIRGAVLSGPKGEPLPVRAGAVIAALGGPAALYARDMSGPGNTGSSYGLLAEAGAEMANAGFIQFMWAEPEGMAFVSPARLLGPESRIKTPDDRRLDPAEVLAGRGDPDRLRESRAGHCPAGYGLEDACLDEVLIRNLDSEGIARLDTAEGEVRVGLFAQAGNGGALIDEHGRTKVRGLFACGECATGMHGANRLGGGMVLATQVFGARAGRAAALETDRAAAGSEEALLERAFELVQGRNREGPGPPKWIRQGMQGHVLLGRRPGLEPFKTRLEEAAGGPDRRAALAARSALAIIAQCPQPCAWPDPGRP
ncbi:MAG: FAD-binding protein [Desulfovibrionaceae bacterium]|nr:FAD-binding protein [Desulfovibrionaceae bacterium]